MISHPTLLKKFKDSKENFYRLQQIRSTHLPTSPLLTTNIWHQVIKDTAAYIYCDYWLSWKLPSCRLSIYSISSLFSVSSFPVCLWISRWGSKLYLCILLLNGSFWLQSILFNLFIGLSSSRSPGLDMNFKTMYFHFYARFQDVFGWCHKLYFYYCFKQHTALLIFLLSTRYVNNKRSIFTHIVTISGALVSCVENFKPCLIHTAKFKMDHRLNAKPNSVKLLEETLRDNLYDLG